MWLKGYWSTIDGEVIEYFGSFPSAYDKALDWVESYRYWYPDLDIEIRWMSQFVTEDYGYYGESCQTIPYGEGRQEQW